MFLISEMLKAMGDIPLIAAVNECAVAQLGLAGYGPLETYGTFLDNDKYLSQISSYVKVVITTEALREVVQREGYGVVVVPNPRNAFFKLQKFFCGNK